MDDSGIGGASQAILPEVQTPPPEETPPTQLEVLVPEVSPSQEAPVLSIDTLTPPPDADTIQATDSSITEEGGLKGFCLGYCVQTLKYAVKYSG